MLYKGIKFVKIRDMEFPLLPSDASWIHSGQRKKYEPI
jgi:hypothetical protein